MELPPELELREVSVPPAALDNPLHWVVAVLLDRQQAVVSGKPQHLVVELRLVRRLRLLSAELLALALLHQARPHSGHHPVEVSVFLLHQLLEHPQAAASEALRRLEHLDDNVLIVKHISTKSGMR